MNSLLKKKYQLGSDPDELCIDRVHHEKHCNHHSKDVNINLLFSRCTYLTMMNHRFKITRILSEKSSL